MQQKVHPLTLLTTSNKPISSVEQRQHIYNQEKQLEKSIRYQEGISESMSRLVSHRENQIQTILEYQNNQQNTQIQAIEDIGGGINLLGDKLDTGLGNLYNGIQQLNENQLLIFQEEIKALGVIDYDINQGFQNLLSSMESQIIIFQHVSIQVGEIIETLHNPRKIEGLEYKRDGISHLQNKWFSEALEYLQLSIEKLTTDQEVYFLIGLIEFEENKNYEEAIINFEKALKYAKGYEDSNIYIQSLDKLASIYFILAGKDGLNNNSKIEKAYDYQLKAVETDNDYILKKYIDSGKTIDIKKEVNEQLRYNLIEYAATIGEYDTFENYLYILLRINSSLILNILTNPIYSKDSKILEIIDLVTSKIKKQNIETITNKEIQIFEQHVSHEVQKMHTFIDSYNLEYDFVSDFFGGFAIVKKGNERNYINERGKLLSPNEWIIVDKSKEGTILYGDRDKFHKDIKYIAVPYRERKIGTATSFMKLLGKDGVLLDLYVTKDYGDGNYKISEPGMQNVMLRNGELLIKNESYPVENYREGGMIIPSKYISNCSNYNYKLGYGLIVYDGASLEKGKIYKKFLNGRKSKINIEKYLNENFVENEIKWIRQRADEHGYINILSSIIQQFDSQAIIDNKISDEQVSNYKVIEINGDFNFEDEDGDLLFSPTIYESEKALRGLLEMLKEYEIASKGHLSIIQIGNKQNIFNTKALKFENKWDLVENCNKSNKVRLSNEGNNEDTNTEKVKNKEKSRQVENYIEQYNTLRFPLKIDKGMTLWYSIPGEEFSPRIDISVGFNKELLTGHRKVNHKVHKGDIDIGELIDTLNFYLNNQYNRGTEWSVVTYNTGLDIFYNFNNKDGKLLFSLTQKFINDGKKELLKLIEEFIVSKKGSIYTFRIGILENQLNIQTFMWVYINWYRAGESDNALLNEENIKLVEKDQLIKEKEKKSAERKKRAKEKREKEEGEEKQNIERKKREEEKSVINRMKGWLYSKL